MIRMGTPIRHIWVTVMFLELDIAPEDEWHIRLLGLQFFINSSLVLRKPVFGVSDLVRHKPGCTATEDAYRLEISDLGSRGIHGTFRVAKTKALISFRVTAKLICVFVFAYAESRFSHNIPKNKPHQVM